MRRILAIAVFLTIVLPIYGQEKGSHPESNQDHSSNADKTPPSPRTAKCVVKENGTAIECDWAEAEPESYFKRLLSPENAPNIGLFFVGLGGVIAAICTVKAINQQIADARESGVAAATMAQNTLDVIKRQATNSRRQAGAALLNAKAVINSQRSWLIPRIAQPTKDEIRLFKDDSKKLLVEIRFANKGKIPATVLTQTCGCSYETVFDRNVYSWKLNLKEPPEDIHTAEKQFPGAVYTPEDGFSFWRFMEPPGDEDKALERRFCIRGTIEYKDDFAPKRMTRFCYVFQDGPDADSPTRGEMPRFRKAGPDSYNEIT
jgi:hypothetical protein